jgi:hypothetical protein
LSYPSCGDPDFELEDKMAKAASNHAEPDGAAVRRAFSLWLGGDIDRPDVAVFGMTSIPYKNLDDGAPGFVDYSKCKFVRKEVFVMSGEHPADPLDDRRRDDQSDFRTPVRYHLISLTERPTSLR